MELTYSIHDGLRRYDLPDDLCRDMLAEVAATRANSYPAPQKVAAFVLTARGIATRASPTTPRSWR